MPQKPIILLAFANDYFNGEHLHFLVKELDGIKEVCEDTVNAAYEISIIYSATIDKIVKAFRRPANRGRIVAFHYGGHAGSGEIMLETFEGLQQSTDAKALADYLALQENLQLVFLNGCSTKGQVEGLLNAGITKVIATDRSIEDQLATDFAVAFYQSLIGGNNIEVAFKDAKAEFDLKGKEVSINEVKISRRVYSKKQISLDNFAWGLYQKEADTQTSGLGRYKHLLCNRSPQVESFCNCIINRVELLPKQPNIYLVYGEADESHSSLISRIAEIELFKAIPITKEEQIFRPQIKEVWPIFGQLLDMQNTLKRQLSNTFKTNNSLQVKAIEIVQQYQSRKGVIVLEHSIDGTDWDAQTTKLLDWYINSFWNIQYDFSLPQVIIFINVKYPLISGGFFKQLFSKGFKKGKIRELLAEIAAKSPQCCRLLPELNPIRINDVNNWIDQYGESQLDYLLEEIFSNDKDGLQPMRKVEQHLKSGLEKLRKQRDAQLIANL
ncbi:MAG: CHAT domain-containing protein [Chitinophagales bacterium]